VIFNNHHITIWGHEFYERSSIFELCEQSLPWASLDLHFLGKRIPRPNKNLSVTKERSTNRVIGFILFTLSKRRCDNSRDNLYRTRKESDSSFELKKVIGDSRFVRAHNFAAHMIADFIPDNRCECAFRNCDYTQVMVRVFVSIVTPRSAGCHADNSPYLA